MAIRAIRTIGGIGPAGPSGASSNTLQLVFSGSLGTAGVAYTGTLSASGGTAPYTYSISAGSLPPGLTLHTATGVIDGTPTTAGTYTFTAQVTDSSARTQTAQCSIQIGGGVLAITYSGTLASVNYPFNAAFVATGGVQPYTFSIIAGSLPTGLSLNTSTGQISGTPTVGGAFQVTGKVIDSNGSSATIVATIQVQYFDVPGASVTSVTASEVPNSVYQDSLEGLHLVVSVSPTVSSPSSIFPVRVRVWLDFDDGNGWNIFGDQYADTATPTFTFGQQTQKNGVVLDGGIWVPSNPSNVSWRAAVEANSHDAQPSGAAATVTFTVTPAQPPTSSDITSAQFIPNPVTGDILVYDHDSLGGWDWLYNEIDCFQPTITQNPYYWFSSFTVQLGYEATGTADVTSGNSVSNISGITLTAADAGMDVHIGGSGLGVGATLSTIASVDTVHNTCTLSSSVPNGTGQLIAIWRQAPVDSGANGIQGTDDDTGNPPLYKGRQFTDSGSTQGNPGGISQAGSWVQLVGQRPANWTLPPALLQDGVTANPYNAFRFRIYSWSRLGTNSTGGTGTSALQTCWQTPSGPNTSDHFDVVPQQQQAAADLSQANPNKSFTTTSPITGGNGSPIDIAVAGALGKVSKQIVVLPGGITNPYIGSQAVQAINMANAAITFANAALGANSVVDSNVASTSIGKLIAGDVVFSGNIALARGNGQAVVTMDNTGIYLFSNCSASGSGVTPDVAGNPTYAAAGVTSSPYVGVTATQIGVFGNTSAGLQPSVTITGTGVNLWSNNGDTTHPYATLTSSAFQMVNGNFTYQQSAAQIQLTYAGGPSATLNSVSFTMAYGSYSAKVQSTQVEISSPAGNAIFGSTNFQLVTGSSSLTLQSNLIQLVGLAGTLVADSTNIRLSQGSYTASVSSTAVTLNGVAGTLVADSANIRLTQGSYTASVSASAVTLQGASGSLVFNSSGMTISDGNLSTTVTASQIKLLYAFGASLVLNSSGMLVYSIDGNTSFPYVSLGSSQVQLINGNQSASLSSTALAITNSGGSFGSIAIGVASAGASISASGGIGMGSWTVETTNTGESILYLGTNTSPTAFSITSTTVGATLAMSFGSILTIAGLQVLRGRLTGPGAPSGFADPTTQSWCQALYNSLASAAGHGLFN